MSKTTVIVIVVIIVLLLLALLGFLFYWRYRHRSTPTPPVPAGPPGPSPPGPPATPATPANITRLMQSGWGTIENQGNCLTATTNPGANTSIELQTCINPSSDNSSQQWKMTGNNSFISKLDPNGTYCLDVDGTASVGSSDQIHFWQCQQQDTTKMGWTPKITTNNPLNYQLVNNKTTSACLDASPGINKQPILQTCGTNTTASQQWVFKPISS